MFQVAEFFPILDKPHVFLFLLGSRWQQKPPLEKEVAEFRVKLRLSFLSNRSSMAPGEFSLMMMVVVVALKA
jgi:hypothetical protein